MRSQPAQRSWFVGMAGVVVLLSAPACGGDDTVAEETAPPNGTTTPPNAIAISTPELVLAAGEEKTYCFFTTLPTKAPIGVQRYRSSMTEGSHHMIVFLLREAAKPDGTFVECSKGGLASGLDVPVWAYASQEPEGQLEMPDGVGVQLAAGQPLMIQMHYLNASGGELRAHVDVEIDPYEEGVEYVPASVFATFNTEIVVPPGGKAAVEGSCDVPEDANFFVLSTHSHRFTTRAQAHDGESMLIDTTDWEHPGVIQWKQQPYVFQSGKLDYR